MYEKERHMPTPVAAIKTPVIMPQPAAANPAQNVDTNQVMYSMVTNIVFMVATNQLISYFNLTDPSYLLYVRVGFAATQALILTALFLLKVKIEKSGLKEGTVEIVEPSQTPGQPETKRIVSPRDYDLMELQKQIRGVISSVLFSVALHYLFKSSHLLIIGSVNAVRALATSHLVRLYVLGEKAEGLLKRPFEEPPSPLAELFKQFVQPELEKSSGAKKPAVMVAKDSDSDSPSESEAEGPIKVIEEEDVNSGKSETESGKSSNNSATNKNVRRRKN
jgi:hypothetical protein